MRENDSQGDIVDQESLAQAIWKKASPFVVPTLQVGGLLLVAIWISLVCAFLLIFFYELFGRHIPTGKTVFASLYAVVGWLIVIWYGFALALLHGWNPQLTKPVLATRRKWRKRIIWLCVALCTGALGTMWFWADIVDAIFALLFTIMAHLYRTRFLHRKNIHGWILFYLAGSFVLLTNTDKVFGYPARDPDFFYIGAYSFWAAVNCYALHLVLKKKFKPWAWVAAALIVMYFPVLELPAEVARQYVGWQLAGPVDGVYYYTKIRPNEICVVGGPSYHSAHSYRQMGGGHYERTSGGAFMEKWDQFLRTPRLALWLNERFIQPHRVPLRSDRR